MVRAKPLRTVEDKNVLIAASNLQKIIAIRRVTNQFDTMGEFVKLVRLFFWITVVLPCLALFSYLRTRPRNSTRTFCSMIAYVVAC